MKKLLISILILFLSIQVYAQKADSTKVIRKNDVRLMLTDLINNAYHFNYERLVGKQLSVGLGVGIKSEEGLIRLSGLDTEHVKTSDLDYSGFKIVPEVRYYFKKSTLYGMDGFYIGAYGKYSSFKSDLFGTYINDDDESFVIDFDAKIRVFSAGLMAGYKLRITPRIVMDFIIAGPGLGFYRFSFKQQSDLPEEFFDDLNEALDNYSLFDFINSDFEFKRVDTRSRFTVPSFRYGISVGYSF